MVFKRFTSISVYISIIFICTFLTLFNAFLMIVRFENRIKREQNYAYRYVKEIHLITDKVSSEQLLKLKEGITDCDIIIKGPVFYFDGWEGVYKPDIYLLENEDLPYPIKNGLNRISGGGIVVPDNIREELSKIKCHGIELRVLDSIDNNEYSDGTSLFLLHAEDYFRIFPDEISTDEMCLRIVSNKEDVYSACQVLEDNLDKYIPDCQMIVQEKEKEGQGILGILKYETVWNSFLVYGFALINVMIISFYWVNVRRREIAIRKAYGANNLSVVILLEKELLMVIGSAAILAFGLGIVSQLAMGETDEIVIYMGVGIGYLILIILALLFAMIIPMRSIMKIQPSEGVKLC